MSERREFTLTKPDFGASPPSLPDGASRWETQELTRLWRNILTDLTDVIARAVSLHEEVATRSSATATSGWHNAAGDLASAANHHGAYRSLLDAIHHRQAMGVPFDPAGEVG